jgi:hypothetical protein
VNVNYEDKIVELQISYLLSAESGQNLGSILLNQLYMNIRVLYPHFGIKISIDAKPSTSALSFWFRK